MNFLAKNWHWILLAIVVYEFAKYIGGRAVAAAQPAPPAATRLRGYGGTFPGWQA
jgi:hypothetical protein